MIYHRLCLIFLSVTLIATFSACTYPKENFASADDLSELEGLGVLDTLVFPFSNSTYANKEFYFAYPHLIVTATRKTPMGGVEKYFLVKKFGENIIHQILKSNLEEPTLKHHGQAGVFEHESHIYIVTTNELLFKLDHTGSLIEKASLKIPEDYTIFSPAQLKITNDKIFATIRKYSADFSDMFCDQTVFQIAAFNLNGDMLYTLPIIGNDDLCGAKTIYKVHLFQYLLTPNGILTFNIFEKDLRRYTYDGNLVKTDTVSFFPFISREELVFSSGKVDESNYFEYVPSTGLSNALVYENFLIMVINKEKNQEQLIKYDLTKKQIIKQTAITGEFIGYDTKQNRVFTLQNQDDPNTYTLVSERLE